MREIKFRAFDKTLFKMFEPRTLRDIAKESPNNGVNWYQFEMMQFTGLTDKNGKDIYEGDIVEQEKNCLFDDGKYILTVCFNGKDQFVSGNCSLYQAVQSFGAEVIGNIYENPELLT